MGARENAEAARRHSGSVIIAEIPGIAEDLVRDGAHFSPRCPDLTQ
jgi:hypothetical protein